MVEFGMCLKSGQRAEQPGLGEGGTASEIMAAGPPLGALEPATKKLRVFSL